MTRLVSSSPNGLSVWDMKACLSWPRWDAWSVVTLGQEGYATEIEYFTSKKRAEERAKDIGNCYVVKGTQMWNEPLGQVEEHDKDAPSKYFP